jgi:hypothetical protein
MQKLLELLQLVESPKINTDLRKDIASFVVKRDNKANPGISAHS